jgi:hypothetical protein
MFDSSSGSDSESDGDDPFSVPSNNFIDHSLKGPIKEFHLNEVTGEVRSLLTKLYHTDECRAGDSFGRRVVIVVECLRSDRITIAFSDIGHSLRRQNDNC